MSFVQATPELVEAAAGDLATIGSTISSANTVALGPTSNVLAPGADEVSVGIAALFDAHSRVYQALSAQAAEFHSQFVQLMNGGAAQYAFAEAANVSPLRAVAAPASVAAQVPAVSVGAVGTSAPAAPAGSLAAAMAPAAAAAAPAPAGTPAVAAPAGSATLASATTPAGAARVVTPSYAPAGSAPSSPAGVVPASSATTPAGAPAAAMQTEVPPQGSGASAMPVSARTVPHAPATAQPTHSAGTPVKRMPTVSPEPL
ncbi:PE family protein [Mycobacterium sp. 94-17]|uniref:PE family protein n=1 Tax=Mycobacterium sp. 94-17 TaxID=2986147 RepID=UPI002D1F629E|nr:PE family protein [Mycobacterium sp. 94-17]MEB4208151.1 PE family protein [Mycobacterium sp. 94-17]